MNEIVKLFYDLGVKRKNDPNCYRYDLFKDRDPYNCDSPQYTWQWNFTKEEYQQIKNLLKNYSGNIQDIIKKSKISCKMLQLYVSEWYKREFNGYDGQGNAFAAINMGNIAYEIWCGLYHNPDDKVYYSNIDEYGNETGKRRWIESIYVDGGLPLHYLLNKDNTAFRKTIKDIIESNNEGIEYSSNDLGVLCNNEVVNQSYRGRASVFDFIQEIIINENLVIDGFEGFIHEIRGVKKEVEIERTHRKPFSFRWLFDFDDNRNLVDICFEMSGPQTLSDLFIQDNHLETASFVPVSVKCNNEVLFTAEYDERYYCRRKVYFRGRYTMGSVITIEIEETGAVLSSHELDLSDPKILSLLNLNSNCYTLCDSKKMATTHCRIIASTEWSSDGQVIQTKTYQINQETYHVFYICPSIAPVVLTTGTEIKTFDPKTPLCWTVIDDSCRISLNGIQTKETLYNVSDMRFYKGKEDLVVRTPQPVKFSAYRSRNWSNTPKLGEIRARIDLGNSESVDPVKFLNVGNLNMIREYSNSDSCTIRIIWNEGTITSDVADSVRNNYFLINRARLKSRYVSFVFTPSPGTGDTFTIHVAPPFFDFKFFDPYSNEVSPNSLIPMVDLHNYRYYLVGNCVNLRFGQSGEEHLQYNNMDGAPDVTVSHIRDTDGQRQPRPDIPNESWLTTFFDGTNTIRNLLEKDARPLTEAVANIRLYRNRSTNFFQCYFKDFPYRIVVTDDDVLIVENVVLLPNGSDNNKLLLPPYRGALLATPIDDPAIAPVKIEPIDNKFVIPNEMKNYPQKQWLIYGDLQGLVLPELIDLDKTLDDEARAILKNNSLERIKEELASATMFDDEWQTALEWFELIPEGRIPASSMLTMVAIADEPVLLGKLSLQLFIKYYDSLETIFQNLNEFQRQMSFLWSWVPLKDLSDFISFDASYMKRYYMEWQAQNSIDGYIPLEKQDSIILDKCKQALIKSFKQWFFMLQYDNEPINNPHPLYSDPKLNAFGDGLTSDEAKTFFQNIIIAGNPAPNERWILERRIVHKDIINGERDAWRLGDFTPEIIKEIHRSIIYGLKFEYNE